MPRGREAGTAFGVNPAEPEARNDERNTKGNGDANKCVDETKFDAFDDCFAWRADSVPKHFFFSLGEAGDVEGEQWKEDHCEEGNLESRGHEVARLFFGLTWVLEKVEP